MQTDSALEYTPHFPKEKKLHQTSDITTMFKEYSAMIFSIVKCQEQDAK